MGHEEARMELVDALSHQLNLDPRKAQALAGGVLGVVEDALIDRAGPDAAKQLEAVVPELPAWKQAAETHMHDDAPSAASSGLGSLLGSALGSMGSGFGGAAGAAALLIPILGKLGISEEQLQVVLPIVSRFLAQRLDGPLLEQVQEVLPFLGAPADTAGILGQMLG
jgi:hypothetical protein